MAQGEFVERRRDDELKKHIDSRIDEVLTTMKTGFPNGDLDGHRRAHEGEISDAKEWHDLWKTVRERTISGGVYAGLTLLVVAVWKYVTTGGWQ